MFTLSTEMYLAQLLTDDKIYPHLERVIGKMGIMCLATQTLQSIASVNREDRRIKQLLEIIDSI